MSDRLVTIAAFGDSARAHLAVARLEAEGIDAFLADENIGAMAWHYNIATGGIKVQVRSSDADRAAELLDMRRIHPDAQDEAVVAEQRVCCPGCHSGDILYDQSSSNLVVVALALCVIMCVLVPKALIFAVVLFLWFMIISRRYRKGWRCRHCGHIWRDPSALPLDALGPSDQDGQ